MTVSLILSGVPDPLEAASAVLEPTMPGPPQLAGRKIPIEIGTEEQKRLEGPGA